VNVLLYLIKASRFATRRDSSSTISQLLWFFLSVDVGIIRLIYLEHCCVKKGWALALL